AGTMPLFSEKLKQKFHQPWFGGGVGALLTILFGLSLFALRVGDGLEQWSYDLPFLLRSGKPIEDVVVIFLDEASYRELKQKPATFDRRLYADLLKRLQAEGAKLAVFDVLFIDPQSS